MNPERIFADTNLFLRYLTNDIPEQAGAIEALLQEAAGGHFTLITNAMVIAEMVWTLESYYKLSPKEIEGKILAMLNTPGLEVSDEELIMQAVIWYSEKNVDFIDAFNVAWMQERGIKVSYTLDRKHFNRFEEIEILVPGEK